jgi:DNA polymerase-1
LHGTVTGRLSSSSPNLQNIPTPEKEPGTLLEVLPIKNIFTHSFKGGCLMVLDYSGMELRVFASLANCKRMIQIHKSGRDFHSMVAIMAQEHKDLDEITDDDIAKLDKAVRYRYKWTNWTLLYGGDEHTLSGTYDIPIDEAAETVRMYYNFFPEVLEFQRQCVQFAEDNGYIESVFGRREYLPYINDRRDKGQANQAKRAAKNMPVQSTASDTLTMALPMIDAEMQKAGLKSLLVNTVHDSILLDVYPDEVDDVAALCKDVMENIAKYAKMYMPSIDFSWLRVPLKVDIEVGTHYGTLEEYEYGRANTV